MHIRLVLAGRPQGKFIACRSDGSGRLWTFDAIVLDGARAANGMASFAEAPTPEGAEVARACIISLANEANANREAARCSA